MSEKQDETGPQGMPPIADNVGQFHLGRLIVFLAVAAAIVVGIIIFESQMK